MDTRTNARRSALQALYQWQITGQSMPEVERQFLEDLDAKHVKLEDFRALIFGVQKHQAAIDAELREYMTRSINSLDPVERAILRMGVYELFHRPEIPARIILNESINLAKTFGAEQSHKYVNGVLDKVAGKHRATESKKPKNSKSGAYPATTGKS